APGRAPSLPPIDGLAEARPWTNREATTAHAVPASLLVLGGGVVGVELAQAYATLGAQVSLVEVGPALIAREESFASEEVLEATRGLGVDVRLSAGIQRVARNGHVTMTLVDGAELTGDELLVAAGRHAATGGLGLDSVGVEPGNGGFVEVDEQLRVPGKPWLYVVGDANGRALLTHVGKHQGRIAADVIAGRDARLRDDGPPPRVIFSDPQVAAVGHTLASAQGAGRGVGAVDHPAAATAGSSFVGRNAPGTARMVVDEDARVLAGATFTGPDVADELHAATIAVVGRVSLDDLWH